MTRNGNVFIVGPGFIGGEVLDLLVQDGYTVTGFVRRESHANEIKAAGAAVVLGDLNDTDKITKEAVNHDVLIHTATADHLPSASALLDAIKQRAQSGKTTTLIHTSGTSVIDDYSKSEYRGDKVYSDRDRAGIDSVPDEAPHREIDLAIVKAQKELGDKAKIAIMIPPLIYGYTPSKDRLTIQIPTLTRFALKHGFAGYLGKGLAIESNIHVRDLARAYVVLLHHLEATPAADTLANPYFFCETTGDREPSWRDVAAVIGEQLHRAGRIQDPAPRTVPAELYGDLFGEFTAGAVGLNSRSRADRLRALGWEPREKDWKASFIEDELPVILKENDAHQFGGYKPIGG